MIKKVLLYILDKILRFFFLFDPPPKKDDGYIYERDFLGVSDYGKEKAEIFKSVTDKIGVAYNKIYNVKTSLYHTRVLAKAKYDIENRFWGLFSFVLFDGYKLDNEDFFNQPSLIVYLIIDDTKQKHLVIVKSKVKHFEILAFYRNVKTSTRNFNERKLIYTKERGFTSL